MFDLIYIHNLKQPLRVRLQNRKHVGPYNWTPSSPNVGRGFYSGNSPFVVGDSSFSLRLEPANDHVGPRMRRITGYYCDNHQSETIQPLIARLPRSRGFLAGWSMGALSIGSIDRHIYATPKDAALAAYGLAERYAEAMRDDSNGQTDEEEEVANCNN